MCLFFSSVNIWMNRPQNNWVSRIAEPRLPGHGKVSVAERQTSLVACFARNGWLSVFGSFFAILLKVDFFFVRASIANTSEGICGFVSRHLKSGANGPRGVFQWICIECNIKWLYYVVTLVSVVTVFYSFPAVQIEISKKKKKKEDWCRTTNTRLFCAGNTCLTQSSPAHRCWRKNNMTAFFIY